MTTPGYDIIGDIHGHADELHALLQTLGYEKRAGHYRHPAARKVIFLGDFIDRGPKIPAVLETVRGMVGNGEALAVLGNHEVNAMRFHAKDSRGNPLRPHTKQNIAQHAETLRQLPDRDELAWWMDWFSTLPLSIEMPGLRAVHASWDAAAILELGACGPLTGAVLERYSRKDTQEYDTISRILNGPEAALPEGWRHETADGVMRGEIRVKWWVRLEGLTCREAVFPDREDIPALPPASLPALEPYDDACPVFFGHYALKNPLPAPLTPRIACLDYGIGKGGFLCAYRWDGEQEINPGKFVAAPPQNKSSETLPACGCPVP